MTTDDIGSVDVALLPTSPAQRRLWLQEQMRPDRATLAVPMVSEVDGRLEVPPLRSALGVVLARHEALRTGLRIVDGELRQLVFDPADVPDPLEIEQLTGLAAEQRETVLRQRMIDHAERPFDLAAAPALRALLLTVADNEQVLLLTVHHAVCDGASVQIVFRELFAEYERQRGGEPVAAAPASIDFGDWVQWQAELLTGESREQQRQYWTTQLADAPQLLELPTDAERATTKSFAGAVHRFEIDESTMRRLRVASRETKTSLFVTVVAAMAVVLHRHSGQDDICIGTPLSARYRPELDDMVGLLLNTVVLRLSTAGDPTLRELLDQTRVTVGAAMSHQELPFEEVVAALDPPYDPGSTPLFQVLYTFEEDVQRQWDLPGARVRVHPSPYRPARNDLAISLEAVGGRGYCDIEYRTALFRHDRIERLAEHYRTVLTAIADDPDQRLSAVDVVTGVERRRVLFDWNDTARDFPRELPVTELFAEHVAHRPDAVAVYSSEENLTYRQLDEATTALALRLRALGVGPENVVGVCVPRSAPMVVALLGVLKAGGAYLALDSCQPTARLAAIVGDSGASVLVTCQDFSDLAVRTETTPVFLHPSDPAPDSGPELPTVDARNLAYVLYTSGSTGRPNGVAVSHRALARLVKNPDYCELGPDEVLLQLSPISFDASLIELWGPLLNGGAIVIPRSDRSFLEQFREGLASHPVTTVLLISPQLPLVLEDRELLGRLRQLLIGGDVLSPRHAKETVRRYPNLSFIHVYGPTESTLFATAVRLTDVDEDKPTVPIGRPITNTGAYVLDRYLRPQPIGVAGELYLSGEGLARGYLHQPRLTSSRFVPNPFGAPGSRLYRTGDLARWDSAGQLEFLGRIDDQVKIRGFRIELGEVQSVLVGHPAVSEATVIVREDLPGGRGLIGYVVAKGSEINPREVREYVANHLPHYMVPVAITVLDRLPLTGNGKLDRKKLPRVSVEGGTVAPARTNTERQIIEIWRSVLGSSSVGRNQDFFTVGGNSLRIMELYQHLERAWPQTVRLGELFELSTVAAQAAAIDDRHGVTRDPSVPSFEL